VVKQWGAARLIKLVERQATGITYRICYETEKPYGRVQKFDEAGRRVVCISPPKPAPWFGGFSASLYSLMGVGLIEILEQS